LRRVRATIAGALAAVALGAVAGCGDDQSFPGAGVFGGGKKGAVGGIKLKQIGRFDSPLYVTQPPGSRDLYVVEKTGRVRIVRGRQVLSRPFLDLSGEVSTESEQGLLSIAFAPDFQESRRLYAYYTDKRGDQRVIELKANRDATGTTGGRRELLRMGDYASNHNGGLLLFGPDEKLYIGTGDGGGIQDPRRNGQDLGSLLGKILRIDPRPSGGKPYGIPDDNPFTDQKGARPEIYAYGLRNPWRFSFDAASGALTIGDVGQARFEEIDYVEADEAAGANFGWSAFEGDVRMNADQSADDRVDPVLVYGREGGCAVTGGYVVRDFDLGPLLGAYVYGDFCEGELRTLVPSGDGKAKEQPIGRTVPQLSSFGEDNRGNIYATSLDGPVFQLVP
jgi:hypothetical protein